MSPSERAIVRERRIKLIFFLGSLILLFLVITQVQNMLISFLFAFVSYYLLSPAVDIIERRGFSRTLATVIPFLFAALVVGVCAIIFSPMLVNQLQTLQSNFPKYLYAANYFLENLESQIGSLMQNVYPINIKGTIQPQIMGWATAFFQKLPEFISQSFTILFLAPFLTFFMLTDGRDFSRKLLSFVPNNFFELTLNLNHQINTQMGGFIRARLIESIVVGLIIWVGLLILDFPYALILALFAGLLNVIPYVGPVLGALPALLISFASGGNSAEILWIISIYGLAQVIDTVVLVPFLVAKIVDLHPVTVVLAIIIGSQLMGILGMIICIPVVSALKVTFIALYKHFTDFRT
ncbi:MAG: AI-2E family transporter [Oligoflexia bacterium]|nr:MAG: AI-2E family transporter [Oligoflexia bacterium]